MIARISPLDACYILRDNINGTPVLVLFGCLAAVPPDRRDEAVTLREWRDAAIDTPGRDC